MRVAIDGFATGASERYVALLNSYREALRASLQQNPKDVRTRQYLRKTAMDRSLSFREAELEMLSEQITAAVSLGGEHAAEDLGLAAAADDGLTADYIDHLVEHATTELTSQIQRDLAQTMHHFQEFQLEVVMQQRNAGLPDHEAHFRAFTQANGRVSFFFKDRAGRRHMSQKFVRTMTRHTLLIGYLESYALHAAAYGARHMEVVHPDQNSEAHGIEVGFRRDQGLPLVSDLKEEVFHPNSNASLKAFF